MNDVVSEFLSKYIYNYGIVICEDVEKLYELLILNCPQSKKEIFVLISAVRENLVKEAILKKDKCSYEKIYESFNDSLINNLGFNEEISKYVVECWLTSLAIQPAKTQIDNKEKGKEYFEEGDLYYYQNEYSKAYDKYLEAYKIGYESFEMYENMSDSLYNIEKYEEASEYCNKALEIGQSSFSFYLMGRCQEELEDNEEGIKYCYEKAVECYKSFEKGFKISKNCYYIGCCFQKLKEYDEALKFFDDAIYNDPADEFSYNMKTECLVELKRYEEAIDCCNEALSFTGKMEMVNENLYNNKGKAFYELNRYKEAIKSFNSALEIDYANDYALYWKENCLKKVLK